MGSIRIVSASAGSGKTYSLAYEYVRNVIREPHLYRHILAVTFTNKATEEMKQRILSKINALAAGTEREFISSLEADTGLSPEQIRKRALQVRSNILHDYGRFSVLTIDKFFQRIIRSFVRELRIDTDFSLELPVDNLLGKAADRVIDNISSDRALREWIIAFVEERIEESKQWDIRAELIKMGREVFTESYKRGLAGSRSREELARIVRERAARAEAVKQGMVSRAQSLLTLVAAAGLTTTDFLYGRSGAMGWVEKLAGGRMEEPKKRVFDAIENDKWYPAKCPPETKSAIEGAAAGLREGINDLLSAYASGIELINSAQLLRENYRNFALLTDLSEKITEVAREENILHITEINGLLSKLISGNDTPFIFEKTGNYFSHFMIDEFQDTSAMQWENFIPLLQNAVSQSEAQPVMLVGDVKQSIYRWRGGDWTILAQKAANQFPENTRGTLSRNFRSRRLVVEFNNAVIGAAARADNARLNEALERAAAAGAVSSAFADRMRDAVADAYCDYLQEPQHPEMEGYVSVCAYAAGEDSAGIPPVIGAVEAIQRRGYAPRDIAILVRRKAEGREIAASLLEHKRLDPSSPYSFDVITQDALVIGSASVSNFIIACMKLAGDPDEAISRTVYNRYLERDLGGTLPGEEGDFLAGLSLKPLEEAFEAIVIRYSLGERTDEFSYLQAFHEQVISYSNSNIADVNLFVQWWEETGRSESISMSSDVNAITIDTIHRAKGLGYKVVIIPYANWSMAPKSNSIIWAEPAERAPEIGPYPVKYKKIMAQSVFSEDYYREYVMSHIDNLNLLYVALTRAKEELHIMMPHEEKPSPERISGLITGAISIDGGTASAGGMRGTVTASREGITVEFGEPGRGNAVSERRAEPEIKFTASEISGRLSVVLKTQRHFEEDDAGSAGLNPRDYGILMHRAFEQAATVDDIYRNISGQRSDGVISAQEERQLVANISEALRDGLVSGWFDGTWESVRNENDIIVPGRISTYRPDRVMTRGRQAVIVDYKFGLAEKPYYARQIGEYRSLLESMGFTEVSAYIWYVNLKKVIAA